MARFLKQSTAFTFRIGPFLDATDAVTAETALTIAQADIQISKNGGAFAQTSAAPTTTHDADGWYQCPLTATDTNTLGPLTVQIVMAGALPVWEHFMVVPANVFDSLVAGSDTLQADVTQVSGVAEDLPTATALAVVDGNVDSILVDTAEIGAAGAGLTAVPWNAAWDAEVQSEAADALVAYDPPTNAEMVARTLLAASYATATNQTNIEADTQDIQARLPAALSGAGSILADMRAISGDATAADRLEALMDGIIIGQVNDAGATTTAFAADGFTEATNDHLNGRLITFITGALTGQQTDITDYVGSTQTITCTALTEAPSNDDFFVVH